MTVERLLSRADIRNLKAKPGDIILIRSKVMLTGYQAQTLRERLNEQLISKLPKGVHGVIVAEPASLRIIRNTVKSIDANIKSIDASLKMLTDTKKLLQKLRAKANARR